MSTFHIHKFHTKNNPLWLILYEYVCSNIVVRHEGWFSHYMTYLKEKLNIFYPWCRLKKNYLISSLSSCQPILAKCLYILWHCLTLLCQREQAIQASSYRPKHCLNLKWPVSISKGLKSPAATLATSEKHWHILADNHYEYWAVNCEDYSTHWEKHSLFFNEQNSCCNTTQHANKQQNIHMVISNKANCF